MCLLALIISTAYREEKPRDRSIFHRNCTITAGISVFIFTGGFNRRIKWQKREDRDEFAAHPNSSASVTCDIAKTTFSLVSDIFPRCGSLVPLARSRHDRRGRSSRVFFPTRRYTGTTSNAPRAGLVARYRATAVKLAEK